MRAQHSKLLAAALCGLVIAAAGAFAVQPTLTDRPGDRPVSATLALVGDIGLSHR